MYYKDYSVLLASKHEKEKAVADVFLNRLSCTVCVEAFDTDKFGTFTGEIPRSLSPYDTCVLKAQTAAKHYGYQLALASEGSFGPHPSLPFMPSDHEIMVFIDLKNDWTIAEHLITEKTNYNMMTIDSKTDLSDFLNKVGFPTHALTLQTNADKTLIAKGIQDEDSLDNALNIGFKMDKELFLATDMRAMMNPTRMDAIRELADKLANRILSCCPSCTTPGFGFKNTTGHLLCSLCGSSTALYAQEVWSCIQCEYIERHSRKDALQEADPKFCDYCNP